MANSDPQLVPVLTSETPRHERVPGQVEAVNGTVDIRKTHPNLYRVLMFYAGGCLLLGINFWAFTPTFLVYGQPNELWGSIFFLMGACKIVFLNFHRSLRLVRIVMGAEVAYFLFFAAGTSQPPLEGTGSFQLPILYLGLAAFEFPLLLEPFINPWTARRN